MPVRRPSRLRPSGPAWGHNPWKCPYGSCPTSLILSILSSTPPFPPCCCFPPLFPRREVFGPRSMTWLPGEGSREGLRGHRWGLGSIYPPPSCLSLRLPWVPTSQSLLHPCPAGQSSHVCVPCNQGTRGMEDRRRVMVEQAGRGPMCTFCPSETLPGSVSPSAPRLITMLIFINSWGFFMPCRPEIDRKGVREGGRVGDRGGGRGANQLNNNNNNSGSTRNNNPSSWSSGKQQLGDPAVPKGPHIGHTAQQSFCQSRATGLPGQFGHIRPWRQRKTNPHTGQKTPLRSNTKQGLLI